MANAAKQNKRRKILSLKLMSRSKNEILLSHKMLYLCVCEFGGKQKFSLVRDYRDYSNEALTYCVVSTKIVV
jgi:hypothetical protein